MDKKFALGGSSERFFESVDGEDSVSLSARGESRAHMLAPALLLGLAFVSFAGALGVWESSSGERGGEISAAVEVIGEAIEAERQGEEY